MIIFWQYEEYPELNLFCRTLRTDVCCLNQNPAPGSADIKAAAKPLNRDGDSISMVYSPVRNPLWPALTWMAGSRVRWVRQWGCLHRSHPGLG